jgi:hypothetical protein
MRISPKLRYGAKMLMPLGDSPTVPGNWPVFTGSSAITSVVPAPTAKWLSPMAI